MRYNAQRTFMKSAFSGEIVTDQSRELPQPPLQKPYDQQAPTIELPAVGEDLVTKRDVFQCIAQRRSQRKFKSEALTMSELAYLLWATQGVQTIRGDNYATLRPVASAGARHPFETYLAVQNVAGLKKGLYRYLALEHRLLFLYAADDLGPKITKAARDQKFAGAAALNLIWSCLPYRGEWRYGERAHKVMLLDAGHVGQALYLACQSVGLGNCCIAAYDQKLMDQLVQVDGAEEFVVYLAAVGRV